MNDPFFENDYINHLIALARGYMPSRIFLTAMELGVFHQLRSQGRTASELANQLGADERAMEILLNALVGMGLLQKKNNNLFSNIKELEDSLLADGFYQKDGIFKHISHLWEAWSHLTEIIRTGKPYEREWTDEMSRNLALFMRQHSKGKAENLVTLVDCSGGNLMLDLGCGPGSYAVAFARRYPHLKIVSLDRNDRTIKIAKEVVLRENLQGRIELRKKDFFVDDIGNDYDLVLLSSIISIFGEEENITLLRKVEGSLKTGGRIVILDLILDESKTRPVSGAMFTVNMLVTTANGRSYSFSELKGWLQELGIKDIRQIPMGDSQVIMGTKL
jgi:ubiquinone/menaquinone biosynthesis C-methylase UbiE